jgi:hypothetical protein
VSHAFGSTVGCRFFRCKTLCRTYLWVWVALLGQS